MDFILFVPKMQFRILSPWRSSLSAWPPTPSAWPASTTRPAPWPRSSTPTSPRSTAWRKSTTNSSWSWSWKSRRSPGREIWCISRTGGRGGNRS